MTHVNDHSVDDANQLGKFLYVVGPRNTAEQRMVKVGANYGELVVVNDGVKEDESIITGNLQKLAPGTAVQPKPASYGRAQMTRK
jgi:membrane fusion protein, multidrug efflux system